VEDVWSMVHAERVALVDDLGSLDAARWDEPSLGGEWTVHDVVAHLVDTARTTRLGFMVGLARARLGLRPPECPRCRTRARCLTAGDVGSASSGGVAAAI
jgi:hypothetical protein